MCFQHKGALSLKPRAGLLWGGLTQALYSATQAARKPSIGLPQAELLL